LTQNERTQALQALRDGRARVCVATDVAARGIDLPNLDLVIHADLPNDAEVMQHRSGRTGRAGRKGVSVLLVPAARKRRAELLLNLAGIDVVWGTAPTADEIRKLDQERMLRDALFAEETTADDLILARALLAERSPEDIATALARLYRARLPSPEDIIDPGQGAGRSRDISGREKDGRASRGDDRATAPRSKTAKTSPRHGMAEGSVWFRAGIGRRKNAEARWLLPMICRRGGIDKHDIGAIRIMDTTTEFEISKAVAEAFAVKIRRPDKEDSIRIEPLPDAPQGQAPSEKRLHAPRREDRVTDRSAAPNDRYRDGPKQNGKFHNASGSRSDKEAGSRTKQRQQDRRPQLAGASPAKPAFGKKAKKHRRG
jgi:ATP-dependent RNA helicase DeaD